MANNCFYDMKITGRKENIKELIQMLKWEGKYENNGIGRVFSCYDSSIEEICGDIGYTLVFGDCAWSVNSAMMNNAGREHGLESETGRLDLIVEVYSSEPGIGFQEHILINKGIVEINDCMDYEEHYVEDYETIEEYNAEYGTNFTEDMVDENGDVCVGGFGDDYGDFQDFDAVDFNYKKGE